MRVRVVLRGWLRDFVAGGATTLDVPPGTTASGVMDTLRIPVGPCLWTVNGAVARYDTELHEEDQLEVAMMAAGG